MLIFRVRPQEFRTHHRAQGEGHDSRNNHRNRNGHGELTEELACDAREETHRHENGAEHKRHCHQRASDFLHRLFCSLIRRQMLYSHNPVHIFHNDYGIVDDNSDCEDESEQGHHIQGESEYEHDSECSNQRNRHCNRRNKGGTDILQGEEYHQNDQNERLEKSPVDVMYGVGNVGGHIERDVVGHSLRETRTDFLHFGPYVFSDLHCVCSGEHIDVDYCCVTAVDSALGVVGLGLKRNPRHIFQSDD